MNKPFSESCEQNKDVILAAIRPYLSNGLKVLEVGSGTGQHAIYFSSVNPQIIWQPTDRREYLKGIRTWVKESRLENVRLPFELDVGDAWPDKEYELVFTANSFHIMNEKSVKSCLISVPKCLSQNGHLIIYGPFNYNGRYTSDSNQRFDAWLKMNDPESGIKNFEWICEIADQAGLSLVEDIEMPANNRILVWSRKLNLNKLD